ncbi:hypothetical protein CYMTET_17327 [Cymbomonas tetramitiformis]|uniref:Uncharacterized protein n=1 Tax=Cymbomonas tetramitiformis TaxID=36881 RepID=A0AAE0L727_9CHLO|nr:hypothetical protein CYMTET_17327 [Cymbomonas tetramitiformis]
MSCMRSVRALLVIAVPVFMIVSLQASGARWQQLQEEMESKEAAHKLEIEKYETQIRKLETAGKKCESVDKSMKNQQEKLQGKLQAKEAELRAKEKELTKTVAKIKDSEASAKDAEKKLDGASTKASQTQQNLLQREEEIEELKKESISALKASRDRAGVLRRGLQGSAALLAEKTVIIEQLNVTLAATLHSMTAQMRADAQSLLSSEDLMSKDKKFIFSRLRPAPQGGPTADSDPVLAGALESLKDARKEHSRLAQEFVAATNKTKVEQQQQQQQQQLQRLRSASGSSASHKAPDSRGQSQAVEPGRAADGVPPDSSSVPGTTPEGDEEEAGEDDGEMIGDIEWNGDTNQTSEAKHQRAEEEEKRKSRIERAMRKEAQRVEQQKYWDKYHLKKEREKKKKLAAEEAGADESAEKAEDGQASEMVEDMDTQTLTETEDTLQNSEDPE